MKTGWRIAVKCAYADLEGVLDCIEDDNIEGIDPEMIKLTLKELRETFPDELKEEAERSRT